jgi:hypothetical protein
VPAIEAKKTASTLLGHLLELADNQRLNKEDLSTIKKAADTIGIVLPIRQMAPLLSRIHQVDAKVRRSAASGKTTSPFTAGLVEKAISLDLSGFEGYVQGVFAVRGNYSSSETAVLAKAIARELGNGISPSARARLSILFFRLAGQVPPMEDQVVVSTMAWLLGSNLDYHRQSDAAAQRFIEVVKLMPLQSQVELLKHPCCVGKGRQALIQVIAKRHGYKGTDLWGLVAHLEEHAPHLDIASPLNRELFALPAGR